MLLTSQQVFACPRTLDLSTLCPGPIFVMTYTDDGSALMAPEEDIRLIEYVERPASHLGAIRNFLLQIIFARKYPRWLGPFLFISDELSSADSESIIGELQQEWAFAYSLNVENRELRWLLFGKEIISNPLLETFLKSFSERVDVQSYPDILQLVTRHLKPQGTS